METIYTKRKTTLFGGMANLNPQYIELLIEVTVKIYVGFVIFWI